MKVTDFAANARDVLGTPGWNPSRPDSERRFVTEFLAFDSNAERQEALKLLLPQKRDPYLRPLVEAMEKLLTAQPAALTKVAQQIAAVSQQPWHTPGGPGYAVRRDIFDYWAHGVDARKPESMTAEQFAQAEADVQLVSKTTTAADQVGLPYKDPWSHTVRD